MLSLSELVQLLDPQVSRFLPFSFPFISLWRKILRLNLISWNRKENIRMSKYKVYIASSGEKVPGA